MADVNKLAPFILKWEGKFVNDPDDLGGATNMGVTIGTWRQCGYDKDGDGDIDVSDLKLLTRDDVIKRILKPHYWDRCKADQIKSQGIANLLVDFVWTSGKRGITSLQGILNIPQDGSIGPISLKAINEYPDQELLWGKFMAARRKFLSDICISRPANKKFLKGWMNRINEMHYE